VISATKPMSLITNCFSLPPFNSIKGNITVKYRWFSVCYLIGMFFCLPVAVFSLSCIGPHVFAFVAGPIAIFLVAVVIVNGIQAKRPSWLPFRYRTWEWLPLWMHSLDPFDRLITRMGSHCSVCSCLQDESRRDASALGIRANQSQLHILEAAKPLAGCDSEAHMCAYDHQDHENEFPAWNASHNHQLSPSHTVTNGHLNVASGGMTMKHLAESTPL
jgi:hypothetical protein